jgi:hypothetical protein
VSADFGIDSQIDASRVLFVDGIRTGITGVLPGESCLVGCGQTFMFASVLEQMQPWGCPAANVNPGTVSTGTYPRCTEAQARGIPKDVAVLRQVYGQLRPKNPAWLADWKSGTDYCREHWAALDCDWRSGRVKYLELRRRELTGTVPTRIAELLGLEGLTMTDNGLTGSIPFQLGFFLEHIRFLDLRQNELSGGFHPFLKWWPAIEVLDFSYNQLVGPLTFGLMKPTLRRCVAIHFALWHLLF